MIKIIIVGETGTGKSYFTFLLKGFLRGLGFIVHFDGGLDSSSEGDFDNLHSSRFNDVNDLLLSRRTEIHIEERQAIMGNRFDKPTKPERPSRIHPLAQYRMSRKKEYPTTDMDGSDESVEVRPF